VYPEIFFAALLILYLITPQENRALEQALSVSQLESMAQETWRDSLDWLTLQKLLVAHQKTISKTKKFLSQLGEHCAIKDDEITNSTETLQSVMDELKELEDIVSGDFTRRGQSISDLVWFYPKLSHADIFHSLRIMLMNLYRCTTSSGCEMHKQPKIIARVSAVSLGYHSYFSRSLQSR
jgi:hypothetical protein